jgi:hypothetical protein
MAVRMRWTDTGADLITPTPRPGATLRSIDEPGRKATHVYMYLPAQPRTRVADQNVGLPREVPPGRALRKNAKR